MKFIFFWVITRRLNVIKNRRFGTDCSLGNYPKEDKLQTQEVIDNKGLALLLTYTGRQ
jgi:hypothetical protein